MKNAWFIRVKSYSRSSMDRLWSKSSWVWRVLSFGCYNFMVTSLGPFSLALMRTVLGLEISLVQRA